MIILPQILQRLLFIYNLSFSTDIYPDALKIAKVVPLYEGRSINKLQNGAIPLILKIGKIRNIRFVGNFILNIQKRIF